MVDRREWFYERTAEGLYAFYECPGECLFTCDQVAILYDSMAKAGVPPTLLRHGPVERIEREAWLMKKTYQQANLLGPMRDVAVLVLPKDFDPDRITWLLAGTGRLKTIIKEVSGE